MADWADEKALDYLLTIPGSPTESMVSRLAAALREAREQGATDR